VLSLELAHEENHFTKKWLAAKKCREIIPRLIPSKIRIGQDQGS